MLFFIEISKKTINIIVRVDFFSPYQEIKFSFHTTVNKFNYYISLLLET